MIGLASASYLSLSPVLLLPPLIILSYDQHVRKMKQPTNGTSFMMICLANFSIVTALLLLLSFITTGFSWEFLRSTYGVHLLLPDLTPNVGLWWYFFIEMFDSFREFFLGVFWLHLGSYVGGLTLRIRRQPLFVITTMLGIFAIFKPYPSVADATIYLSMLALYRHIFPRELVFCGHVATNVNGLSDAIYVLCRCSIALRQSSRACISLPMDICWFRERQLLLRYHPSLESGPGIHGCRLHLGCPSR